jgi:hypothetical protein
MKKPFWKSYFSELKTMFRQNVLFMSILLAVVVTSPIGYSFMSWYSTEVPATLVVHDPVAYPHKYKQKVEYRYYATFYFPDIQANKTISVAERTHFHAQAGDVYLFSRSDKLQTGPYNIYSFIALIQCIIAFMFVCGLIWSFFEFTNTYFSVKKKESTYP